MQILRPIFAQCYRSGGRTTGNRLQSRDFSASSSLTNNNNNINDSKGAVFLKRLVTGSVVLTAVGCVGFIAYTKSEIRKIDEEIRKMVEDSKRYNEALKLLAKAELTQQVSNAE